MLLFKRLLLTGFIASFLLLALMALRLVQPAVPLTGESLLIPPEEALPGSYPTLADYWDGRAQFVLEVSDTGLPMGESETIIMQDGEWWSYVHASDRSAGVIDQCGDRVEFPGCTVIYRSDNGRDFSLPEPVCQFECEQCPCNPGRDHTPQQQYPRVAYHEGELWLVYEYQGPTMMRRSADGLRWSLPERIRGTGLTGDVRFCMPWELIGTHPFTSMGNSRCLAGGPPGIYIEDDQIYIFTGMGQSPGHLGCFVGSVGQPAGRYRPCKNNPLLTGASSYGPLDLLGVDGHPFWDFRMLSSAEVIQIEGQYYMLYEGIRGPGPNDPGDTQFGLGLARTIDGRIDGRWEVYPQNPLLVPLPGNIGLGHADIVIHNGETILFTSLDGRVRSRLKLVWTE